MTSSLLGEGVGGLKDDEWRHDDTGGGAFELKKSLSTQCTPFCRRNFFLNNYAFKGRGSRKMTWWQAGGGWGDDVIYEQPLIGWRSVTSKMTPFMTAVFLCFPNGGHIKGKRAGILSHQNSKPTPWWENLALFSASWRLGLNFVSIIAKSLPIMCSQLVSCVGIISLSMISLFCRILSHF